MPSPALLDQLFDSGLLVETGIDGLYARSGLFEEIGERLQALTSRHAGAEGAEVLRFPPAMARQPFEKAGYMKNFPHLAGTIHAFQGGERDHLALMQAIETGGDWLAGQKPTDVVLAPACCYPLYPIAARRGRLPEGGRLYDIHGWCFRHEPSRQPTRLQSFRMREFVRIGSPDDVTAFRARWLETGQAVIRDLGLPFQLDVANDPFFGRSGKLMASNQRDQALKFELLIPVNDGEEPTACLSFNYHQDHFGKTFGLELADGSTAHTACVGFGQERIVIALFRHHGIDVAAWPAPVRAALWG